MKLYDVSWDDGDETIHEWFSSMVLAKKFRANLRREAKKYNKTITVSCRGHSIDTSVNGMIRFLNMLCRYK